MKNDREKVGLKLDIQKMKTWHLVPSLHGKWIGKQWKQVTDFIFLGSKITANGDCSYEIKDVCSLEKKAMTNLDSILKRRDITLLTRSA